MSSGTIEQWEHTQAELEIRRWLYAIGLWEPGAERLEWQSPDAAGQPRALTAEEIDQVLRTEAVGRIGCYDDGKIYVVPVAYAYDGQAIYGQSGEGLKLRMLRANPELCFEVDQVETLDQWRSVIAWGWFEELHGAEAEHALSLIAERLKPLVAKSDPAKADAGPSLDEFARLRPVTYRIKLGKRTGRALSIAAERH